MTMKLADLTPHPQNPRKITDKKLKMLKKSLDTFGDLSGIVYNKRTGRIVGGHQRAKVLPPDARIDGDWIHVGDQRFAYREVDWDEQTEKAANIAANKGAGEWDWSALTEWLNELDHQNFDMELTMFDEEDLAKVMAPIGTGLDPEGSIKVGAREYSSEEFSTFAHQCPRCGFEFDSSKREEGDDPRSPD